MSHRPVLLKEVIEFLDPELGDFMIDGTANGGGHAGEILKRVGFKGKLLALDWDESQVRALESQWSRKFPNAVFASGNYADLPDILKKKKLGKADGLLLDLGFSSNQLDSGRGFSFAKDEPLGMTYDERAKPLREILAAVREEELAGIIRAYGGERYARQIARAIVRSRSRGSIATTGELRDIIAGAVPKGYERGRIDPATRTFQALRIYANNELENLRAVLAELPDILNPGGRAVVISFHSLEDRIVKQAFRDMQKNNLLRITTKKPVEASSEEQEENRRSRPAKLRAAVIAKQ